MIRRASRSPHPGRLRANPIQPSQSRRRLRRAWSQALPDAKPGAMNEVTTPGPEKGVEPPIIVPQSDSASEHDKKPTTTGTQSAPKPADSSAHRRRLLIPVRDRRRPLIPVRRPRACCGSADFARGESSFAGRESSVDQRDNTYAGRESIGKLGWPGCSILLAPASAKENPVAASSPPPERGKERVANAETVAPRPRQPSPRPKQLLQKTFRKPAGS